MDSSGWQECHKAQSLKGLIKKLDTEMNYWSLFLTTKLGSFLLISPKSSVMSHEKTGEEVEREERQVSLVTRDPLSTAFPFTDASLPSHSTPPPHAP